MESILEKGFAKINLTLDVLGTLPTGFHEVSMIMQSLELCDDMELTKTETPGTQWESNISFLENDDKNLAVRAAHLIQERYQLKEGVRIQLTKRIPAAAGLAGGSTDAAAVLRGMNRLFDLKIPVETLMELGAEMGSDIPYCIVGGTCRAYGRGELLEKLSVPMMEAEVVLVKPDFGISTPWSYRQFDQKTPDRHPDEAAMMLAMSHESLSEIQDQMLNLLAPAAYEAYPILPEIEERMRELGAGAAMMSGSGPTMYGLFEDGPTADQAAAKLAAAYPAYQVIRTRIRRQGSIEM